jgi:uncharacterized protein
MGVIERRRYLGALRAAISRNPVTVLLGPRQCGKTTLASQLASTRGRVHLLDLEKAADRERLRQPELALSQLRGLIIIDEVQRQPGLFTALRPLADRPGTPARFLLLGSVAPELMRGVSESLAGRVGFVDLAGFDIEEIGAEGWRQLWLRGGFPRSFLARGEGVSLSWRHDFIRTFLERDVPQLGIRVGSEALRRFWMMVAHYHGQIWKGSELARSLGVSERSVRHYLDLLSGAYVLRQLQPWHVNVGKRQYKAPKVYVRDSGLLHALLSLGSLSAVESHPVLGASWEGFALEQVLRVTGGRDCYFWGTHAGAELDLLVFLRGRPIGVEFKYADAPRMTKSLHIALDDLRLDQAFIVHPGDSAYKVHERVEVLPLTETVARLQRLEARRR